MQDILTYGANFNWDFWSLLQGMNYLLVWNKISSWPICLMIFVWIVHGANFGILELEIIQLRWIHGPHSYFMGKNIINDPISVHQNLNNRKFNDPDSGILTWRKLGDLLTSLEALFSKRIHHKVFQVEFGFSILQNLTSHETPW